MVLPVLVGPAIVQAQERTGAPPAERAGLPPERRPLTEGSDTAEPAAPSSSARQLAEELALRLLTWHGELAQDLPEWVAWVVLGSPLWAPALLIWLVLRLRNRRRRRAARQRQRSRAPPAAHPPATAASAPQKASPRPTDVPTLTLQREHEILLATAGDGASLYGTWLSLGLDAEAFLGWRRALHACLDPGRWAAALQEESGARLEHVALHWVREVASRRLASWLSRHPLVTDSKLQAQAPAVTADFEAEGLTLTHPDGLGAELSPEQTRLLGQARAALARVNDRPLSLLQAARLGEIRALLPPDEEEEHIFALCLLHGGLTALDEGASAKLTAAELGRELRQALAQHRQLVEAPIPAEGSAAHALQLLGGERLEGVGIVLAAVAGAAFSPATVVLQLSQRAGQLKGRAQERALIRLGEMIDLALRESASPDGKVLQHNLSVILGVVRLQEEEKRLAALLKTLERNLREPLWPADSHAPQPPDAALLELHRRRVAHLLAQAQQARARLLDILNRLAHAGSSAEELQIAHRRLGYLAAGLGKPLLREASTDLLSAGREALAALAG